MTSSHTTLAAIAEDRRVRWAREVDRADALRARLDHSVCATCGKREAGYCSSAYHMEDSDAS